MEGSSEGKKGKEGRFYCSFTKNIPALLYELGVNILLSTYQAGKVIVLGAAGPERLIQLPRTFPKPMGIALNPDRQRMAIACKGEVLVLKNSHQLAMHYPKKPGVYDAMFMPRATYHTNPLDVHDLAWSRGELLAVNTVFSCVSRVGCDYSFEPVWQPPYLKRPLPGDVCHLNGMALENGTLSYATSFGKGMEPASWRDTVPGGGVLWDVKNERLLCEDLQMPHSPRLYRENLYLLQSAAGELLIVDRGSGSTEVLCRPGGFVRGLAFYGNYAFVGHSKFRKRSRTFAKLKLPEAEDFAGVSVVELSSGRVAGRIAYRDTVEEIYDLQLLPGYRRPNILNTIGETHRYGLDTPEATYWAREELL